jgi:hypothetical protein
VQIKAAIDNLPNSDTKKSLQTILMNGADSVDKVEEQIEGWFSDSMDRVSGWYKNKVQIATAIVASLITIFINADTIQIAQKLMLNPAVRDKIVEEAKAANNRNADERATLTVQQKADLSGLTGWTGEFRIFHHLEACGDQNLRGTNLNESACRSLSDEQAKSNSKFFAVWNNDAFPGASLFSTLAFPWLWTVVPDHLVGWILTAIAASLGAPFWFDLLNRFMNIRAAGTAPNEKGSDRSKA